MLSEPGEDMVEIMVALAKLQGGSVCNYFPQSNAQQAISDLESRGLSVVEHDHLRGTKTCLDASLRVLETSALSEDISITVIDETTSPQFVSEVVEMSEKCGVMSVPGWVMRGTGPKGVFLVAQNSTGEPVACAGSFMCHPKSSSHAEDAFWGMLATRSDRRGQGLACLLGAKAIVHMGEVHSARGFITGVSANNLSSKALCNKLGLSNSGWQYLSCIDHTVFGGDSITK